MSASLFLRKMKRKLSWLVIPIFIAITFQFVQSSIKVLQFPALDFGVLYQAGKLVSEGQNPYAKKLVSDFHSPPQSLLIFSFLPFLHILESQIVWFVISFSLFIIGSFFLFKTLTEFDKSNLFKTNNFFLWMAYLSAVMIYFPFRYNLGSGEVNNLLFFFLTISFYYLKRSDFIGVALPIALGIVIKITPLFFIYVFLLQKQFKTILSITLCLSALSLITLLLFSHDLFKNYLLMSPRYFTLDVPVYYNQSLSAFLARIFEDRIIVRALNFLILTIAMIEFTILLWKKSLKRFMGQTIIWNISILYILIFSPFAWQHHFTIAIFPLVTTSYLIIKEQLPKIYLALIFCSYLLMGFNIKDLSILANLGLIKTVIISHVLIGSILLLVLNYRLLIKVRAKG